MSGIKHATPALGFLDSSSSFLFTSQAQERQCRRCLQPIKSLRPSGWPTPDPNLYNRYPFCSSNLHQTGAGECRPMAADRRLVLALCSHDDSSRSYAHFFLGAAFFLGEAFFLAAAGFLVAGFLGAWRNENETKWLNKGVPQVFPRNRKLGSFRPNGKCASKRATYLLLLGRALLLGSGLGLLGCTRKGE